MEKPTERTLEFWTPYTPDTRAPKSVEEKLLQVKSYATPYTVMVNLTPPSPQEMMGQVIQTKTKQKNAELNDVINQMDLTCIYRTFHPNNKKIYLLLSSSWNFLQSWPHIQTESKFKQRQENWYNTLHPIWPPQIKAGYQQQQKAYKLREMEQLSTEQ